MPTSFIAARDDLLAGRVGQLKTRVRGDPSLVLSRCPSDEPPYDGYFNGATLLHHVAGNPSFGPLPANLLEIARVLLDAGAAVDARTRPGPSQPGDPGWTTLGLVASSLEARRIGVTSDLIDLLIERGANVDDRRDDGTRGLPLIGALYYGEPDAAAHLVRRGAEVDFVAACGLGRRELAAPFLNGEGELDAAACSLVAYTLAQRPADPSSAQSLDLGLVFAARAGHAELVSWLVELGADPNRAPCFDHHARALHWAAGNGDVATCRALLAHGADPSIRDDTHAATPAEWARHGSHLQLATELDEHRSSP